MEEKIDINNTLIINDTLYDYYKTDESDDTPSSFFIAIGNFLFNEISIEDGENVKKIKEDIEKFKNEFNLDIQDIRKRKEEGRIDQIFKLEKKNDYVNNALGKHNIKVKLYLKKGKDFISKNNWIIEIKENKNEGGGESEDEGDGEGEREKVINILFYGGKYYLLINKNSTDNIVTKILAQSSDQYYNIFNKFFEEVTFNKTLDFTDFNQREYNKFKNPTTERDEKFLEKVKTYYTNYVNELESFKIDNTDQKQLDKKIKEAEENFEKYEKERGKLNSINLDTYNESVLKKYKTTMEINHTSGVKVNPYQHYIELKECNEIDDIDYIDENYKRLEHIYEGINLSHFNMLCDIFYNFNSISESQIGLDLIILGMGGKEDITIKSDIDKVCNKRFYWSIKPLQNQRKLKDALNTLKEHHYEGIFTNYRQLTIKDFTKGKAQHGGFGKMLEDNSSFNKYDDIRYPDKQKEKKKIDEIKKNNRLSTNNQIVRIVIQDIIYRYYQIQLENSKIENSDRLSFEGLDLGELYIKGKKEILLDFKFTNFEDTYLKNTIFEHINFRKAIFKGSDLTGVQFIKCNLDKADFSSCKMTNTQFVDSTNEDAKFDNVIDLPDSINNSINNSNKHIPKDKVVTIKEPKKLKSYNLRHKTFSNRTFEKNDFSECDFTGTSFSNCTFINCDFSQIYAYKEETFDKLADIELNVDRLINLLESNILRLKDEEKLNVTKIMDLIFRLINGTVEVEIKVDNKKKKGNISFYNDRSMRYYDRVKLDSNYKLDKLSRTRTVQKVWQFLKKLDLLVSKDAVSEHYATTNFYRILFTKLSHKYGKEFKYDNEPYFAKQPFLGLNFSYCTFENCSWYQKDMTRLQYLKSNNIEVNNDTDSFKIKVDEECFSVYGCIITSLLPSIPPFGIKCFNINGNIDLTNYKIIDGKLLGKNVDLSNLEIDGGNTTIDLSFNNSNFNGTIFKNICFKDIDFSNCDLDNSEFHNVQFLGNTILPDIRNVKSRNVYIISHSKSNIKLLPTGYVTFNSITYTKGIISNEGMDLTDQTFENVDFRFHNIKRSKLTNTVFTNCTFSDQQKRNLKFMADNTTLTPFVDNISQKFNYDGINLNKISKISKIINYKFTDTKLGQEIPQRLHKYVPVHRGFFGKTRVVAGTYKVKEMSDLVIINNISDINFRNLNLENLKIGRKFSKRKIEYYKTFVERCDFRDTNINNALFLNTEFKLCRFNRRIQSDNTEELALERDKIKNKNKITAKNCVFRKCNLNKRNWEGSEFKDCEFHGGGKSAGGGAEFKECNMTGCTFTNCEFYATNFKQSIMDRVTFDNCKFKFPSQWQGIITAQNISFNNCFVAEKNTLKLGAGISLMRFNYAYKPLLNNDDFCYKIIGAKDDNSIVYLSNELLFDSNKIYYFKMPKNGNRVFVNEDEDEDDDRRTIQNKFFVDGQDWTDFQFKNITFDNVFFAGDWKRSTFSGCKFKFCKIFGDFKDVELDECLIFYTTIICSKNLEGIKVKKLVIQYANQDYQEIRRDDRLKMYKDEGDIDCNSELVTNPVENRDGDGDIDRDTYEPHEWFIYSYPVNPSRKNFNYTIFTKGCTYDRLLILNKLEKINFEDCTFNKGVRFGTNDRSIHKDDIKIKKNDDMREIKGIIEEADKSKKIDGYKLKKLSLFDELKDYPITKFYLKNSNFKNAVFKTKTENKKKFYGTFEKCNFTADKENTTIKNIDFTDCIFDSCIFTGRMFENCTFKTINKCILNCTFRNCTFNQSDFDSCEITENTKNTTFTDCTFNDTRLVNINFKDSSKLIMNPNIYQSIIDNNKISVIGGKLLICGVKLVDKITVSLKECIFNKIFIDNNPHIIDFNDFNNFDPTKTEIFFKNENRGLTVKSKNVNYKGDLPEGWKKFNGYLLGPNSQPLELNSSIIETEEVIEENSLYKKIGSHIIGPYVNINGLNDGDISTCNLFRIKSSGIGNITLPNHYKVLNGKIYGPYVEIDTLNDDITRNSIKFDHIKITSETANNYIFGSIEELFLDVSGVPKNFKKVKFDNEDKFLFGKYKGRFENKKILWGEGMKHTEDEITEFDLTIDNLKLDNAQLKNCIVKNKNKLLYLKENFIFDGSKIDEKVDLEKLVRKDDNGEAIYKNFKIINILKESYTTNSNYKNFEYRDLPFADILNSNMNGINLGFRVKKDSELNSELTNIKESYEIHGLLIESVREYDTSNKTVRIRLYRGNRFKYEDRAFKALERQSKERAGSEKDITTNKLNIISNNTREKRIIIKEIFRITDDNEQSQYLDYIYFEKFNGIIITINNDNMDKINNIFEKIIDFDETIKVYYTEKSRSIPREYISRYNLFKLKGYNRTHLIGPNMDYSGMDLSGLKFPEGIDLSGCNFNNAKLYDVDFTDVNNIEKATFENVEYITVPYGLPKDINILDDIDDEYIHTIVTGSIESLAGKRGVYEWDVNKNSFINKNIDLKLLLELCTNHKYRLLLPINIEDYFNNYNVESTNDNFNMETFLETNYQKFLKEDAEMEKEIIDIRNLRRDDYEEAHQIFLNTRNNKIGKAIGKHKIKQFKRNKEPNNYRLKKYMEENNWEEINKQKYRNTETGQVLAKPKLLNLALTLESDYTSYSVKDLISLLKGCSINNEGGYYLGIGSIVQDGEFNESDKEKFLNNDFRFSQFINCKFTDITFTGDFSCSSFVGCIFTNCNFENSVTKGLKITFAQINGNITINGAIFIKDCYFKLKHLVGKDIDTSSDVELDVSFYKSTQDPNEIWKFTEDHRLIERGNIQKFAQVNIVDLDKISVKHTFHKKSDRTFNLYDQNKANNSHLSKKGLAQLGKNRPNGIYVKNRFSRYIKKIKYREEYKTIQQRVSLFIENGEVLNLENSNLEGVSLHCNNEKPIKLILNNTNCVDTDFNNLTINKATDGIFSNTKFNNCNRGEEANFSKTYDENGKKYAYYALKDSSEKLLVVGKGINLEGRDISALNSQVGSEEESKPIVDLSKDKLYDVSSKGTLTYENEKIKLPLEYCILEGWLLGEGVNAVGIFSQFSENKGYNENNWSDYKDDNNPDWYEDTSRNIWNRRGNKILKLDKSKNSDMIDDNLDCIRKSRFLNFSFANFKYGNLSKFPKELLNSVPYYGANLSYTNFGSRSLEFDKLRSLKSRAVGKQIIFENSNLSNANLKGIRNANVIQLFKLNDSNSKPELSNSFDLQEIKDNKYVIKRN